MFSNLTIGILVGLGFGTWVFNKLQRYTGGNTQSSLVGAGIIAAFTVALVTFLMSLIPTN